MPKMKLPIEYKILLICECQYNAHQEIEEENYHLNKCLKNSFLECLLMINIVF